MRTDINPRIVDGEPVCDCDCPATVTCKYLDPLEPCIPGLRKQRDEARAERDDARRELCWLCADEDRFKGELKLDVAKRRAVARGWGYLFMTKEN